MGNDVWIGTGCVLLDGADVRERVDPRPNSMISGRIPERLIAAGNPAKVIFTRRQG